MIESLSIRNFKVLRDVDIVLQPLTVIVGPNASGKTSILQSLEIVSAWLTGSSRPLLTSPNTRSRNSDGPVQIVCGVKLDEKESRFTLDLSAGDMTNQGDWMMWNYTFLNLETKKLANPSYPKSTSLQLPSDGNGLPSILAGLRLEQPDRFLSIVNQLKAIVPSLIDIRVKQTQMDADRVGHEILFDLRGAEAIPATAVSEGTLLTLGILTALATSDSPRLALIDDIERGLHPKALSTYIAQLRILQEQNPELQIIATSHSPYLLDYLKAEEVLLTSLSDDGYTTVKPLTDHPDYERWRQVLDPGEFWSTVGEDWINSEQKATA